MTTRIYLDYNATSPARPEVIETMTAILHEPRNASSVHSEGREARKLVEDAREKVAALVNAPPAQVIFNSGATEGNNTVLKYFAADRILVSAIEHPSVLEAAPHAEKIPVTKDGIVDLAALEKLLAESPLPSGERGRVRGQTNLISVMAANNETGAIQPITQISEIAKRHGALFHCDAVQAAGRIPLGITGIDFMTISAHKLGGPQGVGALILGLCGITPTLLDGGGQEKKARAGTENVAGISGFGTAANIAHQNMQNYKKLETLRSALETEMKKIAQNAIFHAQNAPRLPNTTMFSLPGASSETLLMAFDLEGISLSNGSACTSGTVKTSHVLKAMGCNDKTASSAIRVSTGWDTRESDIEIFLKVFEKISDRLKRKN